MVDGNFLQLFPQIMLNGDTTLLGDAYAPTVANVDNVIGTIDDAPIYLQWLATMGVTTPSGDVPGEAKYLYTTIRSLGKFKYQYIKKPQVNNPVTVSMTVPANTEVHFTFGPSYPTSKTSGYVDSAGHWHGTCFKYTGPFTMTANKTQDGTTIMAVAYKLNGLTPPAVESNNQSPLMIAKFKIAKVGHSINSSKF